MNKKLANAVFLTVFLGFLAAVPLVTLLSEKQSVSYWENRALAGVPALTAEGVLDGSFFTGVETCFSDHIAGRDALMKLNTRAALAMGKPVVNGQVVGDEVLLNFHGYARWDTGYQKGLAETVGQRLAALNGQITAYGGYFLYVGVPEQYCYFSDRYPDYMDDRTWTMDNTRAVFGQTMEELGIPFLDMMAVYDGLGRPVEYYSAVDHHYTYAGALVTYEKLLERVNADTGRDLVILREGEGLTTRTLPNRYIGSKSRELYDLWPHEEHLTIGEISPAIPFRRWDNGTETAASLYTLPGSEEEAVLYTAYMGGDIAETVIRTDRPELPNALIFGESFTNPVESVLWTAFNETRSLDLRHYSGQSLEEYIESYRPDVVICLRDDTVFLTDLG